MTGRKTRSRSTKPPGRRTAKAARPRTRRRAAWARLSDEQLMDLRFCDLGLRIEGSPVWERIRDLYAELERRGFRFRPYFWFAEEWFTPDGLCGIGVPFYLGHPRLMRLERSQMLAVEGGRQNHCMNILRHETGHALSNAYRLHRRKRWAQVFGRFGDPYPEFYQPKPYSKSYVLNLDSWYAQSHPAEDFAETFAVWLRLGSQWRRRYSGWRAAAKLEYVDQLMAEIRQARPLVRSRRTVEAASSIRRTLREHYAEKQERYGDEYPDFYDRDLLRLFSGLPEHAGHPSAAVFLNGIRPEIRKAVARWTGEFQYTIDQVLHDMVERSRELKLRVHRPPDELKLEAVTLLTVQTMNYLHSGKHRMAL